MGFITAAIQSTQGAFRDSKFAEFITLDTNLVTPTTLAIEGHLVRNDPDGKIRQTNKNTGRISDGSIIVVPQGYVALMIENGVYINDVAEAGTYTWNTNSQPLLLSKGGLKGLWETFKNRFKFGGQETAQQSIIFVRMQPIAGNKFGTAAPVEYWSERYGHNLHLTFYGLYTLKVSDPVLFFVNNVSAQLINGVFDLAQVAGGTLRQSLVPRLVTAITKFTSQQKSDIAMLVQYMDEFNLIATKTVNENQNGIPGFIEMFGLEVLQVTLEDISYDQESLAITREIDDKLNYERLNFAKVEAERARNEALLKAAENDATMSMGNVMMGVGVGNMMANMMGQQQNQGTQQTPQNPQPQVVQTPPNTFYIQLADGTFVLATKDENGNIVPVK